VFVLVIVLQTVIVATSNKNDLYKGIYISALSVTGSSVKKVHSNIGCSSLCIAAGCPAYKVEHDSNQLLCTVYSMIMSLTEVPSGDTKIYSSCHPPYTWITGQCLMVVEESLNFADAKTRCVELDGILAKIDYPSDFTSYL
ncbi:unnamed protein product, partial [Meganyctiphanes norvegica]